VGRRLDVFVARTLDEEGRRRAVELNVDVPWLLVLNELVVVIVVIVVVFELGVLIVVAVVVVRLGVLLLVVVVVVELGMLLFVVVIAANTVDEAAFDVLVTVTPVAMSSAAQTADADMGAPILFFK